MQIINSILLLTIFGLSGITTVSAESTFRDYIDEGDSELSRKVIADIKSKSVKYTNNLDDELENFKQSSIYVTESKGFPSIGTLAINNNSLRGGERSKYIYIINDLSNRVVGNCYGYDYSCTLMLKFDDKKAKPYSFTATVDNAIYTLEREDVNRFMKEVKSSKVVNTKINGRLYTFDVLDVDFSKIEF